MASDSTALRAAGARLVRYDRHILINAVTMALTGWSDRIAAVLGVSLLVGGVHALLLGRPPIVSLWLALGIGVACGASASGAIAGRLRFHAEHGALAEAALSVSSRHRYAATWHGAGLVMLTGGLISCGVRLLVLALLGYLIGAAVAERLPVERVRSVLAIGRRSTFAGSQSDTQNMLLAIGTFLIALVVARLLPRPGSTVFGGGLAAILLLALSTVDDEAVRFEGMIGRSVWRSMAPQARRVALFTVASAPAAGLILGWQCGGLVAVEGMAALGGVALRVLVYRVYQRRAGDLVASALVGLLVFAGVFMAPLAPLVALTSLWMLVRRASARTWLVI